VNESAKQTTSDLNKQSALVIDYGYYSSLAQALGGKDGFGQVHYGTHWHSYSPTPDKCYMGRGIDGLIHMEEVEDVINMVDVIAFFDVGDYARQRSLRQQGKKVFGSGGSEMIEMDRGYFKDILTQAKLPQPPYAIVHGIDELRKHLQTHDDLWIKIDSKWRGVKETFYHEDFDSSETALDELAHRLGCFRKDFKFIIEDCWPGIETGCDFFVSGGKYLPIGTYGFEEKNDLYLCKAMPLEFMPKAVKKINDAMAPFYEAWNTCGMASTEVRILCEKMYGYNIGEGYFLDATQRAGSPPAEIISALYTNLPHIVRACANGEMIVPVSRAKYAAQVILKSSMAECEATPVSIDKGFEDKVKFRRQCVIDGQTFIIPMDSDNIIGSTVGWGNSAEEAENMALEAAERVHCRELYFANSFDEVHETIQCGEELGLGKF
jgi:hypothetical protein